jgi:hypothetical protein
MPVSRRRSQPPFAQFLTLLASDVNILIITALIIIGVYLLDTATPLGEPVWLLYFIPLVLSYWSERYYAIPTVCVVTLFFLVAGFFLSPPGIAENYAILMRFSFSLIFFLAAILLWWVRGRQIKEEKL